MRWFPPPPPLTHSGQLQVRFEDLTQDGRFVLHCLPTAIGQIAWPALIEQFRLADPSRVLDGAIPILTRLVIEGGGDGHSPFQPLSGQAGFQLAHSLFAHSSEVDRIYVNMWASLGDAGRVFAEHVFTRLFAEPSQRKVTRLDLPGIGHPPGDPYIARTSAEMIAAPEGFTPYALT